MKHLLPLSALVLACFSGSLHAADAPTLLAEYDFEKIPAYVPNWGAGLGSTYKPATGWKTPFKVSLDQENPHSGDNSLRFELLEPSDKEKIVHSPAIKVEPAEGERKVKVRLFIRSTGFGEKGAGIRILERDEAGASIRLLGDAKTLIPVPESPDWVELDAEGVLHSRTASLSFMVVAYTQEAPATLWIDDVSIELVPPAAP